MTIKTRKHIWPVALMSLAVFGVLAAVVALSAVQSPVAEAHPCDTGTPAERAQCDTEHENDGLDSTDPTHSHDNGNGNGMMGDIMHASYPQGFWLEGLDNGARLSWEKPKDVHAHAAVVGYRIERDAWHPTANHPINMYNSYDATIDIHPENVLAASYHDRGLAYNTVYTYQVQALVRHSSASANYEAAVAEWWNTLNCRKMNDAVEGHVQDGPAIGADMDGTEYCKMYAGLSDGAKVVVRRAYGAAGYNLGMQSYMRTIETATSGGLLDALISPPSPPRNVMASETCADPRGQTFNIMVTWDPPADPGRVPANFPGCATCTNQTPIHIGGDDAGIEVQPGMAVITGYKVERMTGNGPWMTLAANVSGTSYTDEGRSANTLYKYRITAMNNASRYSDPSEVKEITVATPPEAQVPTSPDADPIDATADENAHVLITWDPPGTAAGTATWRTEADVDTDHGNVSKSMVYIVQRLDVEDSNANWVTLPMGADVDADDQMHKHQYLPDVSAAEAIDNVQTQEYRDTPDSGSYKYRVSAQLSACDRSEWVVTAREVQFTAEPDPPTNPRVAGTTSSTISLAWDAPASTGSSDITGYRIEVAITGGWSEVATTTATTYTVTGLSPETEYTYRVVAMNEDEESVPSTTITATTGAAPALGAPSITAASNAAGEATITLTPGAHATKHYVWAFRVGGTSNATDGKWSAEVASGVTSVTITGLTSGQSYWFIPIAGRGDGAATQWRWGAWTTTPTVIR